MDPIVTPFVNIINELIGCMVTNPKCAVVWGGRFLAAIVVVFVVDQVGKYE